MSDPQGSPRPVVLGPSRSILSTSTTTPLSCCPRRHRSVRSPASMPSTSQRLMLTWTPTSGPTSSSCPLSRRACATTGLSPALMVSPPWAPAHRLPGCRESQTESRGQPHPGLSPGKQEQWSQESVSQGPRSPVLQGRGPADSRAQPPRRPQSTPQPCPLKSST